MHTLLLRDSTENSDCTTFIKCPENLQTEFYSMAVGGVVYSVLKVREFMKEPDWQEGSGLDEF